MSGKRERDDVTAMPRAIRLAIAAALDRQAHDLTLLDLRESSAFTDWFIICSGQTTRQTRAIAEAIEEALRGLPLRPSHVEGYDDTGWILLDYFDFVVHVFTPATRTFYGLERLWGSAERLDITDEAPGSAS